MLSIVNIYKVGRLYEGTKSDIWSCGIILYALLTGTVCKTVLFFTQYKLSDKYLVTFR